MGSTTLLRGIRISVAALDEFLADNGVDETYGTPPMYQAHPDRDEISRLLYVRITSAGGTADKMNFRVMIPSQPGCNRSTVAYVTYAWVTVWAHVEVNLEESLPTDPPKGFLELRKEILSYGENLPCEDRMHNDGKIGLFLVFTDDIRGLYTPQELIDRHKSPQSCDRCDATFNGPDAWKLRQDHRYQVHGSKEGQFPLPLG